MLDVHKALHLSRGSRRAVWSHAESMPERGGSKLKLSSANPSRPPHSTGTPQMFSEAKYWIKCIEIHRYMPSKGSRLFLKSHCSGLHARFVPWSQATAMSNASFGDI